MFLRKTVRVARKAGPVRCLGKKAWKLLAHSGVFVRQVAAGSGSFACSLNRKKDVLKRLAGMMLLVVTASGAGIAQNTSTAQRTESGYEATRLNEMERSIRLLTGRIETLEREVYLLREQRDTADQPQQGEAPPQLQDGQQPGDFSARIQDVQEEDLVFRSLEAGASNPPDAVQTLPQAALPDADTLFDMANQALIIGDYQRAASFLETFRDNYKDDPRLGDALYKLGEVRLLQTEDAEAAEIYLALIRDLPAYSRLFDAFLKLSEALYNLNKRDDACRVLRAARTRFAQLEDDDIRKLERNLWRASC